MRIYIVFRCISPSMSLVSFDCFTIYSLFIVIFQVLDTYPEHKKEILEVIISFWILAEFFVFVLLCLFVSLFILKIVKAVNFVLNESEASIAPSERQLIPDIATPVAAVFCLLLFDTALFQADVPDEASAPAPNFILL
jgi:hypothetical protein